MRMSVYKIIAVCLFSIGTPAFVFAGQSGKGRILVLADKINNKVSPLTTGVCLEDVNHEIYGGIYSQMIFGESFEEPSSPPPITGFMYEAGRRKNDMGKEWQVADNILCAPATEGARLIAENTLLAKGRIGVEVYFDDRTPGVAGLIVKVSDSATGTDNFNGYEISLDPNANKLVFGKYQHKWEKLKRVNCPIQLQKWIPLEVEMGENGIQIFVNGTNYIDYNDSSPLAKGLAGVRTWQHAAKFKNFSVTDSNGTKQIPFIKAANDQVSSMWTAYREGNAEGTFAIETDKLFNGRQDQKITFQSGTGRVGIANSGLNMRGMYFQKDKDYEGVLWVRADKPVSLNLSLEDKSGKTSYAQQKVSVKDSNWQKIEFTMTSSGEDEYGKFCISLTEPGSVVVGYAFLQPGQWGRFKGLPVRLDVAEALIRQKVTVIRYGGSMVNSPEYCWKKMIGSRDLRPPYKGFWNSYSSNGWGILDFMNFCEAAGFVYLPALNIEETPEDMADFIEYIHGGNETVWGQKRVADGHPEPYKLKYIQIGNEEKVDDYYLERFKLLAAAIWSRDPNMIPVVADLVYFKHISDPFKVEGSLTINTLAAHKEILKFAKENNNPVWFDVHVWNDEPNDPDKLHRGMGMRSFVDALDKLADGAQFKVCIFEENANNHQLRRGLGHAHMINEIQRYEHEMPILCAANCLQPDKQNDNGWNQGLLFLTQSKVWGQSPYYVTQMISGSYQPLCVESYVDSYNNSLDVTACKSLDGKTLSLRVVNMDRFDIKTEIDLMQFALAQSDAQVIQIKGNLDSVNTAENPELIVPKESKIQVPGKNERVKYTFPANSFTIINFKS